MNDEVDPRVPAVTGDSVLQSFTREQTASTNFQQVSSTYRDANMQTVVLSGTYFPAIAFLSTVATGVALGYGGWLAFNGGT